MTINKPGLLFVGLMMALACNGQLAKGDKYFEHSDYYKAIPYYKKEARDRKSPNKQAAYLKLAKIYQQINQYPDAENAYRNALNAGGDGTVEPQVYLDYAYVLRVNAKYEEAAEQLNNYLKLVPNDQRAQDAMKFCNEIKYYMSQPVEYTVSNVTAINTPKSEFCPFVTDGKLMFVAERETFDFMNYEVNNYNGEPFLNMYISNLDGMSVKKSKALNGAVNTSYHEGPACISADGQTLYFTRSVKSSKGAGALETGIFTATGSTKKWSNFKPVSFNSAEYSVAHPSISKDNNTLYFTSNMPGGYGGKDIWMVQRTGDGWGTPVNLGPDINTTGDEMFPSIRKDGILFFSSNGLPGFGGLDIYSAKQVDGKWILQKNPGLNLNSSGDDFGITFLNDSIGYFSSNRAGGKGMDDIYLYEYKENTVEVDGTVLMTENINDFAVNKKVVLLDEKGNPVDSMRTNQKGYFKFRNLASDKNYMALIEEDDPAMVNKARFYLAVKDSAIYRVTTKYGGKRFAFKNLPVDPNGLPDLYTQDELVFAGTLVSGDGNTPMKNSRLKIVNDYGDVVEETVTNDNGAFAFRNIPADQNYLVSIDENGDELKEGTKITLLSKSGKAVRTFYKQRGKFNFRVMNADKNFLEDMDAEDVNLVMGIYGFLYDENKRPIANATIRVKNEDGSGAQEIKTSDRGRFNFKNLDAEKEYLFETDVNDPSLAGVRKIYIADSKGRIYKVIDLVGGKFTFRILDIDKAAMGEFVLDDPTLKMADKKKAEGKTPEKQGDKPKEEPEPETEFSVIIVENIYYAYGEYKLDASGEAILDKAVNALKEYPKLIMEISSHTDSQSSAGFNMGLSNRRAQTAVDYLVAHGIDRARLKARGYGETKLLNHCADGVPCSDDEHKVNRRTEFKITKPIKRTK